MDKLTEEENFGDVSIFTIIVGLLQPRPPDKIFYKFNEKIVNVYSSFPTNNPCNQAVHLKDNRFWSFWIIFWKTIVNFNDFYLLNLWKNLLGGLG